MKLARIKERARALGIKSLVVRDQVLTIHWGDIARMVGWHPGLPSTAVWQHVKMKNDVLRYSLAKEADVMVKTELLLGELEKRDPSLLPEGA